MLCNVHSDQNGSVMTRHGTLTTVYRKPDEHEVS